ncbi:MAG TPA: FAD-dependent oxidoreductase [Gemmatimonadales bacterium]|nr:FAD-dependent oxidoreductase [Gemmatimonadales bacterium]
MPPKRLDRPGHPPVIVVGAGPTGLSAAYHLGTDSLLLEQADRVGGWCRSIEDRGYTFDMAGHIMFSNDPYVHELYRLLLGDNVHWQDREAWIFSKGVYTRYPFQGALYGLPPEVIKECIVGAIEARFGSLHPRSPATDTGSSDDYTGPERRGMFEPLLKAGGGKGRTLLYTGTERRRPVMHKGPPRNFEEFIYKVWGAGIARHFAIPYNRKLWAVPLDEMETSWLGGRVPLPNLEDMIEGALSPVPKPMGPNARFGYPLRGGFQALMSGFVPHLAGQLRLNTRVTGVSPARRTVTLDDGSVVPYETLISTMPLPRLVRLLGHEAPADVREAAAALRHVSVRCVNLGVARSNLTEKHWIYYPEDTVFHRIFVQGNASPYCNAPGGFGLTCEITYSDAKPLPCEGDALIRRCIEDCHRVGIFTAEDEVEAANQVDMPVAYVVYDHARAANVERIREWLGARDIVLAGRYAEWEYYNSDHAFVAGKRAAEEAQQRRSGFLGRTRTASLSAK